MRFIKVRLMHIPLLSIWQRMATCLGRILIFFPSFIFLELWAMSYSGLQLIKLLPFFPCNRLIFVPCRETQYQIQ